MTMEETIHLRNLHQPQPLLVVISGPSGAGKDAVVKALKKMNYSFHFVVTTTDREPRPGEVHGVDYYFVSTQEFERMIAADELLEYSTVYNQYKGIHKSQVREALASGKDVIMRLDVQGAEKVRKMCPDAVLIFLAPESEEAWLLRLHTRNTETEEAFRIRFETAKKELEDAKKFDYVVINAHNQLDDAAQTILSIIEAEHHRTVPRRIQL